ncbi:SEC-C domain-containing protein [Evansella cellulosilytica]|uniref:SEC-C motif domain protein n=1 Tax=Evansella cellulosilytica (strain ATCC 21833 / DSM 2522 / FERM P-1141 / JCM 9156 / N-4) TaxID=649639 RepID=E6TSN8_EVAC2|nr:SEC-C domain-containing protein [Evansella cellulosilytica]ADU29546.1 SEC-C motif domain protein [Evansella cellulosilytica DSM 2522]
MSKRNQKCPCGSGKKYKHCCNVIDIHRQKEENFYEQKDVLVRMMTDFVWGKWSPRDHERMQSIFQIKTGNKLSDDEQPMLFHFFSLFMHRYENGLRGVEWFWKDRGVRLDKNLRAIAKNWPKLNFHLVQCIEKSGDIVLFQDVITNKTYPVANIEKNVPKNLTLLDGTIGLLELHNNKYYFNGVRVIQGPHEVAEAKRKIGSLMKETGLSYEEVLMEYPLEVLMVMLNYQHWNFKRKDIPLLEELGLEHLPAYAEDFFLFYKEKTAGKKANTIRKYRESLYELNEVLKRNHFLHLDDVQPDEWARLLSKDYFELFETMTKTQITDLISVLNAFVKWHKSNNKSKLWNGLSEFLNNEEVQFLHAVQFQNSFFPNRGSYKMNEFVKMLKGDITPDSEKEEGVFEIIKRNKQSFRVTKWSNKSNKGAEYTISGADVNIDYVEEGLIFSGKIAKGRINMWELIELESVYPRTAKRFLTIKDTVRSR